ncbi:MAG: NADH-quinone oxidoreductase subunit L [Kiritimatiellaeota bacterium]|nr:NADH-quinone oxidoreductase subunit L [Kiritimatiellota bacterium]
MDAPFYWIPFFPLLGFLINGLIGLRRFSNRAVHAVAVAAVGLSFLTALWSCGALLAAGNVAGEKVLFTWIPANLIHLADQVSGASFQIAFAFRFDALTAVMCLVVTGVGLLIHIYSIGYMAHDKSYARFFAYLNLFTAAMLVLVLGANLAVMFIGWEGVGLCSYLLIGFWFTKDSAAQAGKKAFITNRIGDFGFLLGAGLLLWFLGTMDFNAIAAGVTQGLLTKSVATAAALLLFLGATGKSAQLPLYTWLPDAMEGPTPVSALIHAATMVTAGVYMVARLNVLFTFSGTALTVVALTGGLTACYAATMGLVQFDIKRVLAYSTISQIGYMFLGLGVGAYSAGIFHLMTHAFFKSLLFLAAGSVIHALSGEQDMRRMGGLRRRIPQTYVVFLIGAIAIAGLPPFAGFFSKDEILAAAFASGQYTAWALGMVGALMTAFYMFRLIFMTFFGPERMTHEVAYHIHESPRIMLRPLQILAGLSLIGGWVGLPAVLQGGAWFGRFLAPVTGHHAVHLSHGLELGLMVASIGVALAGIAAAYYIYVRKDGQPARAFAAGLQPLYTLVQNKYYVDELYNNVIVGGCKRLGILFARFDLGIIDGVVNGAAWLTRLVSKLSILFDGSVVDGAVNGVAHVHQRYGRMLRRLQSGYLYNYALAVVLGMVLLISFVLIY